jgi:hypothetical protein
MDASGFLSATSAPQEEAGGQTETEDRSIRSVRSPLLRVVGKLEAITMVSASALAGLSRSLRISSNLSARSGFNLRGSPSKINPEPIGTVSERSESCSGHHDPSNATRISLDLCPFGLQSKEDLPRIRPSGLQSKRISLENQPRTNRNGLSMNAPPTRGGAVRSSGPFNQTLPARASIYEDLPRILPIWASNPRGSPSNLGS